MSYRDYQIHVRVEPDMRQWLREKAWNERTTMNAIIAGLISNEMEKEKAPDLALGKQSDASITNE